MGGDTPVESRLLTGANGLPNNRPSSMHHRSFDRIAAPLSRGGEKKEGKKKERKEEERNGKKIIILLYIYTADIFVPLKRKRMIGKKLSYSKIRILFSPIATR